MTDHTDGIRADILNHYGAGSPTLALLLATLVAEERADAQRLSADGIGRVAAAHAAVAALHHPVTLLGVVCCNECSGQRRTGPRTYERTAYIPHPCRTIQALNGEEL